MLNVVMLLCGSPVHALNVVFCFLSQRLHPLPHHHQLHKTPDHTSPPTPTLSPSEHHHYSPRIQISSTHTVTTLDHRVFTPSMMSPENNRHDWFRAATKWPPPKTPIAIETAGHTDRPLRSPSPDVDSKPMRTNRSVKSCTENESKITITWMVVCCKMLLWSIYISYLSFVLVSVLLRESVLVS